MAALLPCFLIYAEVGKCIAKNSIANNIYQDWITMYSSADFYKAVQKARNITDTLAAQTHSSTQSLMEQAFIHSSRLK